jgi:hypothetical protein
MQTSVSPSNASLWKQIMSDAKIVPNPTLNRLGLQVVRSTLSHGMYNLRPHTVPGDVKTEVDTLRRDGILILPNFLPQDAFDRLHTEFFDMVDHHIDKFMVLDNINLYQVGYVNTLGKELIPNTFAFLKNPRVRGIFEGAEKRPWDVFFHLAGLEVVTYGESGKPDPQISMHADSFYHTHKAWLYMEDVTTETGPLAVIKGTHHLTIDQLPYIYSHSNRNGEDGSRRITQAEMERLGLKETLVTCKKNTLVIANTHAYHRRTQGINGAKRYAVHIMARAKPFTA